MLCHLLTFFDWGWLRHKSANRSLLLTIIDFFLLPECARLQKELLTAGHRNRNPLTKMWGSFVPMILELTPPIHERGISPFKCWRQIHVSRDDAPVEQREHPIGDVILADWWWVGKRIVTEKFGQDAFRVKDFAYFFRANAQLFKLDIGDSALTTAVFELIGLA